MHVSLQKNSRMQNVPSFCFNSRCELHPNIDALKQVLSGIGKVVSVARRSPEILMFVVVVGGQKGGMLACLLASMLGAGVIHHYGQVCKFSIVIQ